MKEKTFIHERKRLSEKYKNVYIIKWYQLILFVLNYENVISQLPLIM